MMDHRPIPPGTVTSRKKSTGLIISLSALFAMGWLTVSGFVLLSFHARGLLEADRIGSMDKSEWLNLHKIGALATAVLVGWHLLRHRVWIRRIPFKSIGFRSVNRSSSLLFHTWNVTATTGLIPWLLPLASTGIRFALVEIHDKLGIVLTVFLILHLVRKWPGLTRSLAARGKRSNPKRS